MGQTLGTCSAAGARYSLALALLRPAFTTGSRYNVEALDPRDFASPVGCVECIARLIYSWCVAPEGVGAVGVVGDALTPRGNAGVGGVGIDVALAERRGRLIAGRL